MRLVRRRAPRATIRTAPGWTTWIAALLFAAGAAGAAGPAGAVSTPSPKPKPLSASQAKADSDKPIEITADRLDVDQNAQVAIFTGNVRATQVDISLTSRVLKVSYSQKTQTGARPEGAGTSQSFIQKLEASGRVVVEAPGEKAEGEQATYDVASRVIHISGNVVLTRDGSVLKGERLTIDFASGQSRMEGGEGANQGRVHGLFVPQRRDEAAGAGSGGR